MNGISLLHSCSLCCHAMLLLCGDTKNSCLDQAPHWEKKEKKIGVGKKRRGKADPFPLSRSPLYFCYFTPFFAFFANCGVWFQARVAAGFVAHNC